MSVQHQTVDMHLQVAGKPSSIYQQHVRGLQCAAACRAIPMNLPSRYHEANDKTPSTCCLYLEAVLDSKHTPHMTDHPVSLHTHALPQQKQYVLEGLIASHVCRVA